MRGTTFLTRGIEAGGDIMARSVRRPWLAFVVLVGLLVGLAPTAPTAAAEEEREWIGVVPGQLAVGYETPVTVQLLGAQFPSGDVAITIVEDDVSGTPASYPVDADDIEAGDGELRFTLQYELGVGGYYIEVDYAGGPHYVAYLSVMEPGFWLSPWQVGQDELREGPVEFSATGVGTDWSEQTQVSLSRGGAPVEADVQIVSVAPTELVFTVVGDLPAGMIDVAISTGQQTLSASFRVLPGRSVCQTAEAGALDSSVSDGLAIGFEDGLDAWTIGHETDEVAVVGTETFGSGFPHETTVAPFEGAHMVRLGGAYDSAAEDQPLGPNEICQDFVVTSATERFAFNIFTYDYSGFDEFRYDVRVQDGSGLVLAQYRQEAFGPGGDTSLKSTGWRGVLLDLSGRVGDTVRITISAGGTRDEAFAFWAYVDSASEENFPDPVPVQPIVGGSGSVMTDPTTGQTTIAFPVGTSDFGDLSLAYPVSCGEGLAVESATYLLGTSAFEATVSGGLASVTIPAAALASLLQNTQALPITLSVDCEGGSQSMTTLGQIVLYDPSGYLTDADTGEPVQGAKVYLYHVPGWQPQDPANDIMGEGTCQSHLSKDEGDPWDQPAPTELGVLEPSGSNRISPRVNPFISNADGYYGWDVAQGCWYVVVVAEGYQTLTSPVVGVPPEVTDLDLELTPTGGNGGPGNGGPGTGGPGTGGPGTGGPGTGGPGTGGPGTGTPGGPTPPRQPTPTPPGELRFPDCDDAGSPPHPDVPAGSVHGRAIACAAGLGMVQGLRDGTFDPGGRITRGQLASMLARLLESIGVDLPAGTGAFTDLGATHADAIRRLHAAGIVQGYDATRFGTADPVTRAQLMALLDRISRELLTELPAAAGPRFPDTAGSFHQPAIDRLAGVGIARGKPDGTFGAGDPVRRDQAASFLIRWLEWQRDAA
jgi:hypothetical protein